MKKANKLRQFIMCGFSWFVFFSQCFARYSNEEPASADCRYLTRPILFCKRFNYQGLHIYDTFYQWRPGGGIYVLENPSVSDDQHKVRPVIDPTTPGTLGEGIYFDP
jgi:hypothetical protein